jgi:hypothetical protein
MSKSFIDNIKKGKKHLAIILGLTALNSLYFSKVSLKKYIFGVDGNGGDMLKIYNYLTDQEITYIKFNRRAMWHAPKLEADHYKSSQVAISDQELYDRGIILPREPYVEYNKRPPHDFYL